MAWYPTFVLLDPNGARWTGVVPTSNWFGALVDLGLSPRGSFGLMPPIRSSRDWVLQADCSRFFSLPASTTGSVRRILYVPARPHMQLGYSQCPQQFILGIVSVGAVFASFPVVSALASRRGFDWLVWAVMGVQLFACMLTGLSYGEPLNLATMSSIFNPISYLGCIFIFITAASPNRASLGSTNGLCQMVSYCLLKVYSYC